MKLTCVFLSYLISVSSAWSFLKCRDSTTTNVRSLFWRRGCGDDPPENECCFIKAKRLADNAGNVAYSEGNFIRVAADVCHTDLGFSSSAFYLYGGDPSEWTAMCAHTKSTAVSGDHDHYMRYECHKTYNQYDGVAGSCID